MNEQKPVDVLTEIIDATARRQADQAMADRVSAKTYAAGMGISQELAALKIAYGRDYGFGPAQSLTMIHVIGGTPVLAAAGRANLLKKAGYDWRSEVWSEKEVRLRFMLRGEPMLGLDGKPLTVAFTFAEAERAGYVVNSRGKGDKGNYDRVPVNMLFARCLTNFHRWYAAEVDGSQLPDASELTLDRVVEEQEQVQAATDKAIEVLKERVAAV